MSKDVYQSAIMGFFDTPEELLSVAQKLQAIKKYDFEVFSPFPIHGMDEAQGLERSILPFITLAAGLTGAICGFTLEYWTSVVYWPISVGGKPMNSWPAFVPIAFECTILFAGFGTFFGMLFLNSLPKFCRKPLDEKITSDQFAIVLMGHHAQDILDMRQFLESLQAQRIQEVTQEVSG